MRHFSSLEEAATYLGPLLDQPVPAARLELTPDIHFQARPVWLGATFSNSYTVSWRKPTGARIFVTDPPISTRAFAQQSGSVVTTTGGFFFLADNCRFRPRMLSLNLAIQEGRVLSVPVATQDALVSRDGSLSVVEVPARGELSLGDHRLHWAGSRTRFTADCYVYGNANSVILHQPDERTGKIRVFQEESRFTPKILDNGWSDLGFAATADGCFEAVTRSDTGRLDIFQHDLVVRCPRVVARQGSGLELDTVGPLAPRDRLQGAISVGPSLSYPDPYTHPLNDDRSLGSFPLLRERPSTRLVFYQTADGWQHLCLFDGRPGSPTFPGLTLDQAISTVSARGDLVSGCLLDSGNTSKLNVVRDSRLETFGNRHYVRWPSPSEPRFTWSPDQGRPVASVIALC
jgi:hypothetical protein